MRVGSSPDKAGTVQYCQMGRVRRTRREGVTRVNQWMNLRNRGTGSNLVDLGRDAVHAERTNGEATPGPVIDAGPVEFSEPLSPCHLMRCDRVFRSENLLAFLRAFVSTSLPRKSRKSRKKSILVQIFVSKKLTPNIENSSITSEEQRKDTKTTAKHHNNHFWTTFCEITF